MHGYSVKEITVPGWSEPASVAFEFGNEMAQLGYAVTIVDFGKLDYPTKLPHIAEMCNFPATEQVRANAVLECVKSLGTSRDQVSIVAHSQGAVAAILAAHVHKKYAHNIIAVAPAGVVKSPLIPLILRYIKSLLSRWWHVLTSNVRFGRGYFKEVIHYALFNPIQLARDAFGITRANIVSFLSRTERVTVIAFRNDHIFPLLRMRACVPQKILTELDGRHDEMYFRPDTFSRSVHTIISTK